MEDESCAGRSSLNDWVVDAVISWLVAELRLRGDSGYCQWQSGRDPNWTQVRWVHVLGGGQTTATGMPPMLDLMRASHSLGPVSCTETPLESTATVTGMSRTSNS